MIKTLVSAFGFLILMLATVAFAAPVPETGQMKCYDVAGSVITCPSPGQALYGQDANYSINPMSYTKLDGSGVALPDSAASWVMVKDNVTGLIWEMKTNMDGVENYNDPHDADNDYARHKGVPPGTLSIEDFIKSLNDANYGSYSDWRMPTIKELSSIVNYSIPYQGPAIDTGYFPNTVSSWYWSSTVGANDTDVNFSGGCCGYSRSFSVYVRAVRGGQTQSAYVDNSNGTVTDTSTGLMWQKASSSNKTWEEALVYCEGLNLGGHTDWRLPTIKELRSLVDYSRYNPAINTTYFPNTSAASWYLSSTTYAYNTADAWVVDFYDGDVYDDHKGDDNYVRAVRGGQTGSLGNLVLYPASRNVAKDAGTTTFSVSNTGTGTMSWSAAGMPANSWLTIQYGVSGTNSGTINCSFTSNTSTSARTGTIQVTALGATGSPKDVMVTQAGTPTPTPKPTACTATIDGNLSLHVPYITYPDPRVVSLWAYFVYEYNPTYPALILFKLTPKTCNPYIGDKKRTTGTAILVISGTEMLKNDGLS